MAAAAGGAHAAGGSWGTLSEIALAQRVGKRVVCLHGWRVRDADDVEVPLVAAASPAEAVDLLSRTLER